MPYILNKTNGAVIAIVQDAAVDLTTDLTFVGKNFSGYGEVQNENFLKLLENFSNSAAPAKPIEGQIWYDTVNKRINFYDNSNWKSVSNIEVDSTNPQDKKSFITGDLWFDKSEQQLHVFNGSTFVLVGPVVGADTKAGWRGSFEYNETEGLGTPKYNIKAVIGINDEVIATVSPESYTLISGSQSYPIYSAGSKVYRGINLTGADPNTGISETQGSYFWGSAAHALIANTATFASAVSLNFSLTEENQSFYVPFINSSTNAVYADNGITYNPNTNILTTIASSALYADLAERYEADNEYEYGTVVVIGGQKEITLTHKHADVSVLGVVSKKPAYMMNSDAGPDKTHPYIALRGRVPCKVLGNIKKGELLVTSSYPGFAEKMKDTDNPNAVLGRALENFEGVKGLIEIVV